MGEISDILLGLGLEKNEVSIFLFLHELNVSIHPSVISRRLGINRSTVYLTLRKMEKKKLVSSSKRSGQLTFRKNHIKNFLDSINSQVNLLRDYSNYLEQNFV